MTSRRSTGPGRPPGLAFLCGLDELALVVGEVGGIRSAFHDPSDAAKSAPIPILSHTS